jgi:hypothetical protein
VPRIADSTKVEMKTKVTRTVLLPNGPEVWVDGNVLTIKKVSETEFRLVPVPSELPPAA